MRTETLWQGQRRAARTHWWRQVLERPAVVANWGEVMDEMAMLRFGVAAETPPHEGMRGAELRFS